MWVIVSVFRFFVMSKSATHILICRAIYWNKNFCIAHIFTRQCSWRLGCTSKCIEAGICMCYLWYTPSFRQECCAFFRQPRKALFIAWFFIFLVKTTLWLEFKNRSKVYLWLQLHLCMYFCFSINFERFIYVCLAGIFIKSRYPGVFFFF
jgi:hypothetical protein